MSIDQIIIERTGYNTGDRIKQYIARIYLSAGLDGLRFAYGDTETEARAALENELQADALAQIHATEIED